jgi:xanthine/CO dehydrogenase XdhC/CoxF family maturation factor
MPFSWVADARAESDGIVLAVDVRRHARDLGFESSSFVSRGVWARFIGAGPGQDRRLVDTLRAASAQMTTPARASEDGTALMFRLCCGGTEAMLVSLVDRDREAVTFMLWDEFTHRPPDGSLRVRVVAEEEGGQDA